MGSKFVYLIFIHTVLYIDTGGGIFTRSWTHYFGQEGFLQDRRYLTSPGQVYGYCNETNVRVYQNKFKVFCTFAVESTEAVDSPEHLRICDFSLISKAANKNESYLLKEISAVTEYKAILRVQGSESNLLFILNFADCRATKAKLDIKRTSFQIYAPSENKFDVVFLDSTLCPGHACRTIVDTDGKIISEAHAWINDKFDIVDVADSPTKGRIVVDEYKNGSDTRWARIYTTENSGNYTH